MYAFPWIFLCHLESCDSINFMDKTFPFFILSYYLEGESCINGHTLRYGKPKLQYNVVTQTLDNSIQITIPLGTYLHVD